MERDLPSVVRISILLKMPHSSSHSAPREAFAKPHERNRSIDKPEAAVGGWATPISTFSCHIVRGTKSTRKCSDGAFAQSFYITLNGVRFSAVRRLVILPHHWQRTPTLTYLGPQRAIACPREWVNAMELPFMIHCNAFSILHSNCSSYRHCAMRITYIEISAATSHYGEQSV